MCLCITDSLSHTTHVETHNGPFFISKKIGLNFVMCEHSIMVYECCIFK